MWGIYYGYSQLIILKRKKLNEKNAKILDNKSKESK